MESNGAGIVFFARTCPKHTPMLNQKRIAANASFLESVLNILEATNQYPLSH